MILQTKYLCIDDAGDEATYSYLDFISDRDENLSIEPSLPIDFIPQLDDLKKNLKPEGSEGYNGLILDLRLDVEEGSKAKYRAPALAQEIHTRGAEDKGTFPICPLVLWSNDDRLNESYWPDDTSHDLFDLTIFKEKLASLDENYAHKVARKLVALANGYPKVAQTTSVGLERAASLLNVTQEFLQGLDPRIIQPLTRGLSEVSIYDQSRFIHSQLLTIANSALVDSEVLAARLGMDVKSIPDFNAFAESLFPSARHQGVFAYGWSCWWMPLIESLWDQLPNCPGPLRELTAEQRVQHIIEVSGRRDIIAAQPIEPATSTVFWTICQITRRPMDPMDGYVLDRQLHPWQLTQYVSLIGKLTGGKKMARMKIDPLDLERYEEDKVKYVTASKL